MDDLEDLTVLDDSGAEDRTAELLTPADETTVRRFGRHAWMWVGILILAAIAYLAIAALAEFVIPLVVAVVLGVVFVPLVDILARSMPRVAASIIVLVGLVVAIVASLVLVVVGVVQQGPQIASEFQSAFAQLGDWLSERGLDIGSTADLADDIEGAASEALPALLDSVPSAFSGVSSLIAGTFVALFILYFVLQDWDSMARWAGAHLGVPADLGAGIVDDATDSFREYFYVLTASSLPVAAMVGVAAAVMGVPLAFTIALITMVTSYIPYVGALISTIFALLIAFGSGGIMPALVMAVVIILAQGVVQPLIQTRMQRDTLDIYPVVGFGATVVGTVLAGALGATLSAPVVAMILRVRKRIRAYARGEDPLASDDAESGAGPAPDSPTASRPG